MPSFDVVSRLDRHELVNALDQANREVNNRFDFKNTGAKLELVEDDIISLVAPSKFQLQQLQQILEVKLVKRGIGLGSLEWEEILESLHEARQKVKVKHGIDQETGKKIIKLIKQTPTFKVQASLMGDQIRITGKKKDELQKVISFLKSLDDEIKIPIQFENFRD
jgi:Uncharacterized protein conserved in bacteria